jgi:hypothetical protein
MKKSAKVLHYFGLDFMLFEFLKYSTHGLSSKRKFYISHIFLETALLKKIIVFPVPSRDVTNLTLPGREILTYSRPGRVWFVTSRLGTGKTKTFFTMWFVEKEGGLHSYNLTVEELGCLEEFLY